MIILCCIISVISFIYVDRSIRNSVQITPAETITPTPTTLSDILDYKEKFVTAKSVALFEHFCMQINNGDFKNAYEESSSELQATVNLDEFTHASQSFKGCKTFDHATDKRFELKPISNSDTSFIIYIYGDFVFKDGTAESGRISVIEEFNQSGTHLLSEIGDKYLFNGFLTNV